ncbi:MAG: SPOR domain-containing protein, partial [Parasphingopyxis sp.]|nr:SPOR domain-containing protein [Sphingomonadales bacterium]
GSAPSASSGRLIQLGAFSSEAAANRAWQSLSGRYGYLSSLDQSVSSIEAGGRTLYRLRAAAGSAEDARRICGRLRVATEDCSIVAN